MANVDRPFGFRAVKHSMGGEIRLSEYHIASGYGTNIGYGDPVKSTGTAKRVQRAAAGDKVIGVFAGCFLVQSDGTPKFSASWPSGTVTSGTLDAVALVYDDPNILFEVQASLAFANTAVGSVADFVIGTMDAVTGESRTELDSSTISSSGSANLKIIELSPVVGNAYGSHAKANIIFNEHELIATRTAV